jgi:mono/diheme cytochrome c family protein
MPEGLNMPKCSLFCSVLAISAGAVLAQEFRPVIPRAWDDAAVANYELPLARADRSPRYPNAAEYYAMPVREVYRTYPFYSPDKEPPGYFESLLQKEPEILFDASKLKTKEDWIRAGELVFDSPIVRVNADPAVRQIYLRHSVEAPPTEPARDGVIPGWYYIVPKKGVVQLGFGACSECHTRRMSDGSFAKGAQSNFAMSQGLAWRNTHPGPPTRMLRQVQAWEFAPWSTDQEDWARVTGDDLVRYFLRIPPGVQNREGASLRHPAKIPALYDLDKIRYMDATGLGRNRDIGDMMRYAIVNQGMISFARFGDYEPKPRPQAGNTRYSDEQLYALSLYLYSLKPPKNPNVVTAETKRGEVIFARQGCAGCHPAPLYTNNKLAPAPGFEVPEALRKTEAILDVSVGTDSGLALETRRGTGFYKVPSLRGVWMRSAFGHEGSAASIEEWLDPARLRDDYEPKGFHAGPGPIRGHEFGMRLTPADRAALISFLKTL